VRQRGRNVAQLRAVPPFLAFLSPSRPSPCRSKRSLHRCAAALFCGCYRMSLGPRCRASWRWQSCYTGRHDAAPSCFTDHGRPARDITRLLLDKGCRACSATEGCRFRRFRARIGALNSYSAHAHYKNTFGGAVLELFPRCIVIWVKSALHI
jgi:hypothetical protein